MTYPAKYTTDQISDVTVMREIERIKKFIVGKTVTDFGITAESETTITVTLSTADKKWDITLPRGGVIPENIVYTNVEQVIPSKKEFTDGIAANDISTENIAVVAVGSEQGLLVEGSANGVKVSGFDEENECVVRFGANVKFRDPYVPEAAEAGTKDYVIGNIVRDKEEKSNRVSAFSETPSNLRYPSEKLVYDRLEEKENTANKVTSFSDSPSNEKYPSEKLVYDSFDKVTTLTPTIKSVSGVTYSFHNFYRCGRILKIELQGNATKAINTIIVSGLPKITRCTANNTYAYTNAHSARIQIDDSGNLNLYTEAATGFRFTLTELLLDE